MPRYYEAKRLIKRLIYPDTKKYPGRKGIERRRYDWDPKTKPVIVRVDGVKQLRYRTGAVAAKAGVEAHRLRDWERRGLIPPSPRDVSVFQRYYTPWQLKLVCKLAAALLEPGATVNSPKVRSIVSEVRRQW